MEYDWTNIKEENIFILLKKDYILLKNNDRLYIDGNPDQYILTKKYLIYQKNIHKI
jgi:hypothetical protein